MNDAKMAKWLRVYEEMERASLILRHVQRTLSTTAEDEHQFVRDVQRLARRGDAVLHALDDAYRAASHKG